MLKRSRPRKISAKRLAKLGGKIPYSTIRKTSNKESVLIQSDFSPDGYRYIASLEDWDVIRRVLGRIRRERCERCNRYAPIHSDEFPAGHAHHLHGRGMSGGKRDDRILILNKFTNEIIWNLGWLCFICHGKEHGQNFS